jgi:hypothetical protein
VRSCGLCEYKGIVDCVWVHVEAIGLGQTLSAIVVWEDELERRGIWVIWVRPTRR